MPIFISHSHQDRDFVDRLAHQLVTNRVHIWLDRWEMNVGDSLIDKIQSALTDASALLVILSPDSVDSEWCRRELNAGIVRELEERQVVVLPVLLHDCNVPLFLREKLYADFRTNFDQGLNSILEAVASVTNEWRNRLEDPQWHTDWSVDWGEAHDGTPILRINMVESDGSRPYSVLSVVTIVTLGDDSPPGWAPGDTAQVEEFRRGVIRSLESELVRLNFSIRLSDHREQASNVPFQHAGTPFVAHIATRWLGADPGRDILFYVDQQFSGLVNQMDLATASPSQAGQSTSAE